MKTRPTIDRTAERGSSEVAAASAIKVLNAVIDTLSERERAVMKLRFGLVDGAPRTWQEIGETYGVTRERIRQIEQKTLAKLRQPERAEALREVEDISIGSLPAHVQERLFGHRPRPPRFDDIQRVWCERHQVHHGVPAYITPSLCGWCGCLPEQPGLRGGRPRRYCNDACKQAAYRARRFETSSRGEKPGPVAQLQSPETP